jgi:hypothetical protein
MRAPPFSGSDHRAAYRFGRARLVGWAGFGAWAESAPAASFLFFFAETVFLFSILKQTDLVLK